MVKTRHYKNKQTNYCKKTRKNKTTRKCNLKKRTARKGNISGKRGTKNKKRTKRTRRKKSKSLQKGGGWPWSRRGSKKLTPEELDKIKLKHEAEDLKEANDLYVDNFRLSKENLEKKINNDKIKLYKLIKGVKIRRTEPNNIASTINLISDTKAEPFLEQMVDHIVDRFGREETWLVKTLINDIRKTGKEIETIQEKYDFATKPDGIKYNGGVTLKTVEDLNKKNKDLLIIGTDLNKKNNLLLNIETVNGYILKPGDYQEIDTRNADLKQVHDEKIVAITEKINLNDQKGQPEPGGVGWNPEEDPVHFEKTLKALKEKGPETVNINNYVAEQNPEIVMQRALERS